MYTPEDSPFEKFRTEKLKGVAMSPDVLELVAKAYEGGFIDGMQKQMQSSVDRAVNRMAEQPAQQEVDWEKLYRLEVKKKEALAAKYERDTGKKLTRIVPMAEQPAQPQQELVAWMFQHEETGRTMCVDAQQVEWGFEKGNPRLKKIAPLYTSPPAQPQQEPNIPGLEADPSAFVRWASKNGYDMTSHPLHFLFLNEKTSAARAGWKAAREFYTSPPASKPLTDEAIKVIWRDLDGSDGVLIRFARAIEAAHGIKE